MLVKLSNLGSGQYDNVFQDFKFQILDKGGIYDKITPLDGSVFKSCILPSTIFKLLAEHPDQFRVRQAAFPDMIEQFWNDLFSTPEGLELQQLHPMLKGKTVRQLRYTLPLRIHEDAGPYTRGGKSVNIISWSSLLGSGSELETKYHCF